MHSVYFVVLDHDGKFNSDEYRERAIQTLEDEEFFNQDENSTHSSPTKCKPKELWGKGDWGVVGGRWSGILTELLGKTPTIDTEHQKAEVAKLYEWRKDKTAWWGEMPEKEFKKRVKEERKNNPRNTYEQLGYEDDAKILTPTLLKALKNIAKLKGWKDANGLEFFEEGIGERSFSELGKSHLGKVIVVIDYHNQVIKWKKLLANYRA